MISSINKWTRTRKISEILVSALTHKHSHTERDRMKDTHQPHTAQTRAAYTKKKSASTVSNLSLLARVLRLSEIGHSLCLPYGIDLLAIYAVSYTFNHTPSTPPIVFVDFPIINCCTHITRSVYELGWSRGAQNEICTHQLNK